jgi:hypothetical protein
MRNLWSSYIFWNFLLIENEFKLFYTVWSYDKVTLKKNSINFNSSKRQEISGPFLLLWFLEPRPNKYCGYVEAFHVGWAVAVALM